MSQKKFTIGYIRISSRQGELDGISLDRQRHMIEFYAQSKAMENLRILSDAAISGFKDARPAFRQLITLCKKNKVERIIVADLSRLSRSVRTTLEFVDEIIAKKGIGFISLAQEINTETPMGKAFLAISAVFNQLYRDEIAYKMRQAWKHKREKGEKGPGIVPYGFKSENGQLIPEVQEQSVIQFMVRQRNAGNTYSQVANELTARGISTKMGKRWHGKTIRTILARSSGSQLKAA